MLHSYAAKLVAELGAVLLGSLESGLR